MGLIDTLKKAEERSREAARRLERVFGLEDKGRALRRKMRIIPSSTQENSAAPTPKPRTPIISINGKDVPQAELIGKDRRSA